MERIAFILWLVGALVAGVSVASGQTVAVSSNAAPASGSNTVTSSLPTDVPIKEVRPGVLQLGDVTINRNDQTVSFPARFNLDSAPMEYFLVASWGKIHESILKTDTQPYRIHVGMLLLGAHGAGTNNPDNAGPPTSFVSHPAKVRILGDDISVEVTWQADGKEIRHRAGELIYSSQKKSALTNEDWAYNGSRMYEDGFVAQSDGSIVSLVTDWAALINNNAPGHDDDSVWTANTNNLPPTNATVQVIIKLKNSSSGR